MLLCDGVPGVRVGDPAASIIRMVVSTRRYACAEVVAGAVSTLAATSAHYFFDTVFKY